MRATWIAAAGLQIEHVDSLVLKRYDFDSWAERMRMPAAERAALEAWLIAAPARCREFFELVAADGQVQSICGAFALTLVVNVLFFAHIDPLYQSFYQGLFLIVAVVLGTVVGRLARGRR